jgi:N-acetyl-anhydromuramyl-L-alanine amidase AmpD
MKQIMIAIWLIVGSIYAYSLEIIQKPIDFNQQRIDLTKEYIATHYGKRVKDITIDPKIIVIHWTAVMSLKKSFERLKPQLLLSDRGDISSAGALNVSAHYLVDRDGIIYQLMPENWMARHVIGLNYNSIGIENVGGENNEKDDLTDAQLKANVALVLYLKKKYPHIEYLIGHFEYQGMQKTPLWLEKDANYRTQKVDPGERFISDLRLKLHPLDLKKAPNKK